MKRAQAQAAIDEAFADGLKNLFSMLERNSLSQGNATAAKEFTAGVAKFDQAHSTASAIIEKIFTE